jgi:hypothetical protein
MFPIESAFQAITKHFSGDISTYIDVPSDKTLDNIKQNHKTTNIPEGQYSTLNPNQGLSMPHTSTENSIVTSADQLAKEELLKEVATSVRPPSPTFEEERDLTHSMLTALKI